MVSSGIPVISLFFAVGCVYIESGFFIEIKWEKSSEILFSKSESSKENQCLTEDYMEKTANLFMEDILY